MLINLITLEKSIPSIKKPSIVTSQFSKYIKALSFPVISRISDLDNSPIF